MKKKLVSIIIPTYSRPSYLIRAINSVICQSYLNIEIIVVDDNGRGTPYQKETEHLLKEYVKNNKITYIIHDVNLNGSAARNTGIRYSHGDYITFLDDDDVMYPNKIEVQVETLELQTDYDIVYSGFCIYRKGKMIKKVIPTKEGNMQYGLLSCRWSIGTGSNPLFTRKVFEMTGLFDETFIRHQDVEFLVRAFRDFKVYPINQILIERHLDSRINMIDCQKLISVKEKLLCTFQNDIEQYEKCKRGVIYRNQYADVAFHAIKSKNYKVALEYYKKANSYASITPRIIAKALLYILFKYNVE